MTRQPVKALDLLPQHLELLQHIKPVQPAEWHQQEDAAAVLTPATVTAYVCSELVHVVAR